MVGADAVAGCFGGEFHTFCGFFLGVTVGLIGLGDEGVVVLAGNDEKFGHRVVVVDKLASGAEIKTLEQIIVLDDQKSPSFYLI